MAKHLRGELKKAGDPAKADGMRNYLKTDQPFYGVQAGPRRKIFREAAGRFSISSRQEYNKLVLDLWNGQCREEMYLALDAAERYPKYRDGKSWPLYEKLMKSASNWDTLDWICAKLLGPLVLSNRKFEKKLVEWSAAKSFWVRRASLLTHLHHREQTNTALLAETILKLCQEKEFFIRKAIGWVLRDYSYTDPAWVKKFVEKHGGSLSGLSRREALKQIQREQS